MTLAARETDSHRAPALTIAAAQCRYGKRLALDDVSLEVARGEIYALLGPNGAGKSTLMRVITGRLGLAAGRISLAGETSRPRATIGYVPQQVALFEALTAQENLEVFARVAGVASRAARTRTAETLALVGLKARAGDRADTLSGGMRRRLHIAAALLHGPSLLLLDEPMVGVDAEARASLAALMASLREAGMAVLIATHHIDEAEAIADRVGILVDGRLRAEGPPAQLVAARFGQARLARVTTAHGASDDNRAALRSFGLAPGPDGRTWSGVVPEDGALQDLLALAARRGAHFEDITIANPSLSALVEATVRDAGAVP